MRLLTILVICLASTSSFADQNVTTLDQLILKTLENNPEIKASRASYDASAKRPSQEGTLPNPEVGVKYRNAGFGEITLGDDQMTHLEFSFSQKIPFPGKLSIREEIAESGAEIRKWEHEARKRRVIAELKRTYFQWFLVNKTIEITEENRDLLRKFTEIARVKYEVGKGIQQDVTKAHVELSKFLEKLEILKSREETVRAKLRSIVNTGPDTELGKPVDKLENTPLTSRPDELREIAKANAPILKASKSDITMKESSLSLARKNLFPDIKIGTAYANRGLGDDSLDGIWEIGVGVEIPLYFWKKEKPAIDEAELELSGSMHSYDDTANEIDYMISQYYLKAETANNLIGLYENGIIPQAKMSLDSSISAYQVGKTDFLALLDDMVTLFTFEIEYYRKLAEYRTALADIEEITGTEISKFTSNEAEEKKNEQ